MKNAKIVVTAALIQSIEIVLNDMKKHRYSVSGIYNAHNALFGKNETPEACTSCLTMRGDALKKWYEAYTEEQAEAGKDVYGNELAGDEAANVLGDAANSANEGADVKNLKNVTFKDVYAHYGAAIGTTPEEELAYLNTALGATPDESGTVTDENDRNILIDRYGEVEAQLYSNADPTIENAALLVVKDKDGNAHEVTYTPEDGDTPGALTWVNATGDIKSMKPGKYTDEAGNTYGVQVGGKTSFTSGESIL